MHRLHISRLFILSYFVLLVACGQKESSSVEHSALAVSKADPAASIQAVMDGFAQGQGGIVWKAMPTSYQKDINDVVQLAGSKMDAETYDRSFALLDRLADVVNKQKAFLIHSKLLGVPEEDSPVFLEAWPAVYGLFRAVAESNIATVEGLSAFEGERFFETTVSQFAQYSGELSKLTESRLGVKDFTTAKVSTVASDGTSATLQFSTPGQEASTLQEFVMVEDRWVPLEIADNWTKQIEEQRKALNAISKEELIRNKPRVLGILGMLEGVSDQLEAAETQEQFDQALQGAMMPIIGLMMLSQPAAKDSADEER